MNIKYFLKCGENQDNDIMMNYYISKKSINTSEIRGNITLKIPLDDSILVNLCICCYKFFIQLDKVHII